MNIKLRTETENHFLKEFFKLKNNATLEKTMKNVRQHGNMKLVTTDKRRNYLVSKPNYHRAKWFSENLLEIEMNIRK